jgi:hypothetical protein
MSKRTARTCTRRYQAQLLLLSNKRRKFPFRKEAVREVVAENFIINVGDANVLIVVVI